MTDYNISCAARQYNTIHCIIENARITRNIGPISPIPINGPSSSSLSQSNMPMSAKNGYHEITEYYNKSSIDSEVSRLGQEKRSQAGSQEMETIPEKVSYMISFLTDYFNHKILTYV